MTHEETRPRAGLRSSAQFCPNQPAPVRAQLSNSVLPKGERGSEANAGQKALLLFRQLRRCAQVHDGESAAEELNVFFRVTPRLPVLGSGHGK